VSGAPALRQSIPSSAKEIKYLTVENIAQNQPKEQHVASEHNGTKSELVQSYESIVSRERLSMKKDLRTKINGTVELLPQSWNRRDLYRVEEIEVLGDAGKRSSMRMR